MIQTVKELEKFCLTGSDVCVMILVADFFGLFFIANKSLDRWFDYENFDNFGLPGLQAQKLQLNKRKEEPSRQNGIQEVLQVLQ